MSNTLNESFNSNFIKNIINNTPNLKYSIGDNNLPTNSIYSYLQHRGDEIDPHSNYIVSQICICIDKIYMNYLNLIEPKYSKKLFLDNTKDPIISPTHEFKEYAKVDEIISTYDFSNINIDDKNISYINIINKSYNKLLKLFDNYMSGNFEISFNELPINLRPLYNVTDDMLEPLQSTTDIKNIININKLQRTPYHQYIIFIKDNSLSGYFYKNPHRQNFSKYHVFNKTTEFTIYKEDTKNSLNTFKNDIKLVTIDNINLPIIPYEPLEEIISTIINVISYDDYMIYSDLEYERNIEVNLSNYKVFYIKVPENTTSKYQLFKDNYTTKHLNLPDNIKKEPTFNYIHLHPLRELFPKLYTYYINNFDDYYVNTDKGYELREVLKTLYNDITYIFDYFHYTDMLQDNNKSNFNFTKILLLNTLYNFMSKEYSKFEKLYSYLKKLNSNKNKLNTPEVEKRIQYYIDFGNDFITKFNNWRKLYNKKSDRHYEI